MSKKDFKSRLLSSVLDITEHMNDLRTETFINAIGKNNEDANKIADEFKQAWDLNVSKENELAIVKKELELTRIESVKGKNKNSIVLGRTPYDKIDYEHSKEINDKLFNDESLIVNIPESKISIPKNLILATMLKDGSFYLLSIIIVIFPIHYVLFRFLSFGANQSLLMIIIIYVSGTIIAYMKSKENIANINSKKIDK
jgi:hypothetical protein